MRMRKKKNSQNRIEKCSSLLLREPELISALDIYAPFPAELRGLPVRLEIGCGKGGFICGKAAADTNALYYAVERIDSVILFALERRAEQLAKDAGLPDNVRFIIGNAAAADGWFPAGSLDEIYLNFSDPWPKKGYYKRRLTYRGFLSSYSRLLRRGGRLCVKTDNETLFDFTLAELENSSFSLLWQTRDLHASLYADGNIITEYESRFISEGMPIYALTAENKADSVTPPPAALI